MYRPIADILADFNKPVPPEKIKTKTIKGKVISYIPWVNLIDTLLAIAPGWSWEIRTQYLPDRVIIEGRLTIRAQEGDFFMESTGVEDVNVTAYGDAVYNAEASALRRAMAKLGYALDLWRKEKKVASSSEQVAGKNQSAIRYPLPATSKISTAQASRLYAIASNEAGLSRDDVKTALNRLGYESSKDIPMDAYDSVVEKIRKTKFYSLWQGENDAIAWAMEQLPDMTMHRLNQEWASLKPVMVDDKPSKAIAWIELVNELKKVPF